MLTFLPSQKPFFPFHHSSLCISISYILLFLFSASLLYSLLSLHTPFPNIPQDLQNDPLHLTPHKDSLTGYYYFDHLSGCIRKRGFKKSLIEKWDGDNDDKGANFIAGSGGVEVEYRSESVFASDDSPVDENVRRKVEEVKGIEDLLMLKLGRRVSPLREGWGDWFEKKGGILKNNRMFKSNWAALDPMRNLMLQDPHEFGVSGFTKGDRNSLSLWMHEFERYPFLGGKSFDRSKVSKDSDLEENYGELVNYNVSSCKCKAMSNRESTSKTERYVSDNVVSFSSNELLRSELKKAEHWNINGEDINQMGSEEQVSETREGNSEDHVGKLDKSSGSENVTSESHRRPEVLDHIYADGERWGYYPGLPPNLTFSEFMDAFLRMGKCDMRVFMVWNSPPWMYSVRHQRGLESLLYHHRDACVVVFTETIELDFFRDNFVNDGYKVAVAMPNLDELLKDTPTHAFASIWFEWRKIDFYPIHYSELIRLAALYKYGGVYLDSDIIVLKPISSLSNSVGMEDDIAGSSLNGAVMAFRRHSLFIKECLREFYLTYEDTSLRWNGADLLTRVARNFLTGRIKYIKQMELKEEPFCMFFPISSQNITRYFMAPTSETEKAQQDVMFRSILHKSLAFHFWNSLTSALVPEPESLVSRLINHFCIRCLELL